MTPRDLKPGDPTAAALHGFTIACDTVATTATLDVCDECGYVWTEGVRGDPHECKPTAQWRRFRRQIQWVPR